ncbi:hypothetical protein [Runella sp.]|jgi:hypothetical protein|uniref:hypothetical protein n=1 Tax=Runella sp. TaxID=1960881 RepID=UPI00260851D9|nr:hypothetical protein [Runella sp.]
MNAISDFIDVKEHTITYSLPPDFDAKRVQIIILPIDEENGTLTKKNRIRGLRKSISGKEAERLEAHVKEIREEW